MRKLLLAGIGVFLLAGCGGSSKSITGQTSTGTTGGGTATTPTVAALTLTTSSPSILSDGSTSAGITALVRDGSNNLVAGVPVTFSASSGGVAVTQATTDTLGAALATLSTAGVPSLRTITVTATASGKSATIAVQVVSGTSSTTLQMGNLSPTGVFTASAIGISSTSLSAGGSATLTVALQQSDGTLYTQPATITFNSTCTAQGLAKIASTSSTTAGTATTSTGVATATYTASGCSLQDIITATATVGTNSLAATGKIQVAAASIGSILFKSVSHTIISLKGSGTTAAPETSMVIFQVLDQSGNPSPGASVKFTLNTQVGGVTAVPGPVISDANGNVQTTVQAGTVATPVRVTATVLNITPTISTQSNQLSVSTGIPTQAAFSLAVACHNVEALNYDGIQVQVTARLADRFSNPVADGTAVQFNSEGGHIQPQCTTATAATESGVCSVYWTSANPRPTIGVGGRAGRSTIIATAIGEESFVDANGNGAFDPGETFTDLGERYRDDNGNLAYDSGEYFYDFNGNGMRDGADGIFNGILCNDPARCDSSKSSTGIGIDNLIIMSGSTPDHVNPANGSTLHPISVAAGSYTYYFTVADVNDNPMPAGTIVKATLSGTGLAISLPAGGNYTYPCTTDPITYAFTVTVAAGTSTGGSGTLLLDVTTGGDSTQKIAGVDTTLSYTFQVAP